ncbi:fad binding domain-containing protein, partial [Colletotrichum incanum]
LAEHGVKVIIVGAAPGGRIRGLLRGKHTVPFTIIEQTSGYTKYPKATQYALPAMKILNRTALGNDVPHRGLHPNAVSWHKLNGTYIIGLENEIHGYDPDRMVSLPMCDLTRLIYDQSKDLPMIKYLFHHRVTGIGQDDNKATGNQGERLQPSADYIVGCDGANSIVRRSLFGTLFPGMIWDEQIAATNAYFGFDQFGYTDSNFILDPEDWFMTAKTTKDGVWRVPYGDATSLKNEQIIGRQPERFKTLSPGHPKPNEYKLISISPYKVHQRLAESMVAGRILFAADTAHLYNPFGGLGLTGGIVDVDSLFECSSGIRHGKANETILL